MSWSSGDRFNSANSDKLPEKYGQPQEHDIDAQERVSPLPYNRNNARRNYMALKLTLLRNGQP
jgi:hypothetical protein